MKKVCAHLALGVALVASLWTFSAQRASAAGSGLDLLLVLDNSGSMKQNDPQFLTRAVVTEFVNSKRLPADARVGVVMFADNATLTMPLTPIGDARQALQASLEKLDYSGRLTDTAAAIERALYELKHQARPDADRAIVLMTDGIIDTGNSAKDAERYRWITTDLADSAAAAGTRIYGVAFTEKADFQLIQSLGEITGGDYYRILRADEVAGAFSRIAEGLTAKKAAVGAAVPAVSAAPESASRAAAVPAPQQPAANGGLPTWLLVLGPIAGLIGLVAAFLVPTMLWRTAPPSQAPKPLEDEVIPKSERAFLRDLNSPPVLSPSKYEITQRITKIGRMKGRAGVLRVDRGTVSAQHAEIRYHDGTFFLVDTASANKTRLDESAPLQPYVEVPLKDGRIISIADCRFEFYVPEADQAPTQVLFLDPTSEHGIRVASAGKK
jgi:Mg-chelatase subunit ChlD